MTLTDAIVTQIRIRSLAYLAPQFRGAVVRVVERMTGEGHDPAVFETLRLAPLQAEYFRRGTSKQRDVLRSMHAYGYAADIISASKLWAAPAAFWDAYKRACAAEKQTWGGRWTSPVDQPHMQFGAYQGAVPDALVARFNRDGLAAVWVHDGVL